MSSDKQVTFEIEEVVTDYPKVIFIVPYRDRQQHYEFFSQHMARILDGLQYRILYIHQKDTRSFNRGAMKNIGFLTVKDLYPTAYKNITLVFNDIDTMPFTPGFLNYDTTAGVVKHFYGFTFTLGGIVSMNAGDFERVNGFPNYWAWGFEDNELNRRVIASGIRLDRSQFFPIMDKNILQLQDGFSRAVNRTEFDAYATQSGEGINSISQLVYDIEESTGFVNVTDFKTNRDENVTSRSVYDLRTGNTPFKPKTRGRVPKMKMFI
jgi:hypothetical protein